MLRKLVFVGMILVLMASFTAVLADQDALDRYCNSDQYGCWVTNEEGGQDYIMFWSESARELFMGPGSNAVVADPVPAGKMSLGKASAAPKPMSFEEKLVEKPTDEQIKEIEKNVSEQVGEDMVCAWNEEKQIVSCRTAEDAEKYPYCTSDGSRCYSTQEGLDSYLAETSNTNTETNTEQPENEPILRSSEGKSIEEMKDWLVQHFSVSEEFKEWLATASDEDIKYNYEHLNVGE